MHLNEDKEINEIKQTELFNETALLYRLHKVYHHENESDIIFSIQGVTSGIGVKITKKGRNHVY